MSTNISSDNVLKRIERPDLIQLTDVADQLSEQDKAIYAGNNLRLNQLETQLHNISTFGGACDELIEWLKDKRAYNIHNENSLIACIAAIYENAVEFGRWSSMQILKVAASQKDGTLSEQGRVFIKECYSELHNFTKGRRPSNASVISSHSINENSTISSSPRVSSSYSPAVTNVVGSPSTSSVNHLMRSVVDPTFFPQSPVSVSTSPHASPHFKNATAVNNITPNNELNGSTASNTDMNNYNHSVSMSISKDSNLANITGSQIEQELRNRQLSPQQVNLLQQLTEGQIDRRQNIQIPVHAPSDNNISPQLHTRIVQMQQPTNVSHSGVNVTQTHTTVPLQSYSMFTNGTQNFQRVPLSQPNQGFVHIPQTAQSQQQSMNAHLRQQMLQRQQQQQQQHTYQLNNFHQQQLQELRQLVNSREQARQTQQQQQAQQQAHQQAQRQAQQMAQQLAQQHAIMQAQRQQQNQQAQNAQLLSQQAQQAAQQHLQTQYPIGQAIAQFQQQNIDQQRMMAMYYQATTGQTNTNGSNSNPTTPVSFTFPNIGSPQTTSTPTTQNTPIPMQSVSPVTVNAATTAVVSPATTAATVIPTGNGNTTTTTVTATPVSAPTTASSNQQQQQNTTKNSVAGQLLLTAMNTNNKRVAPTSNTNRATPTSIATPSNSSTPLYPATTTNPMNLHLPGGGLQNTIKTVYNPEADKLRFKFKSSYAIKPFSLQTEGKYVINDFKIKRDDFDRIWRGPNMTLGQNQGKVALTYVLNCHLSDTAETKCDWPDDLFVSVNETPIKVVRRIRNTSPTGASTYQGKDLPHDLTNLLKYENNRLIIKQHKISSYKTHLFSVQIYNRFSENYIRGLARASTIAISETEALLYRLLGKSSNGDEDDLVVLQETVRVSLKCPITMTRIQYPVRGKNCKHINCFDLLNYIMLNDNNSPSWKCPHCNTEVGPEQLARDLYTEKLLVELPKTATEIEYTKDNSDYTITNTDDAVDDDIDSDDETAKPTKVEPQVVSAPVLTNVIDLISDDEEEDPLPKRPRNN